MARLGGWLLELDCRIYDGVAARTWPGADRVLPRLSRAANHGVLWFATAAGIATAASSPRARRAAVRGVASLALASATVNTLGKRSVRRARPVWDAVPPIRRLKRRPVTTSFPSGHSASAAAFATGVALESRGWGAAVAPLALAVGLSRVYTGVHFPSDVLAGGALGVAAAFAVRGMVPTRGQLPVPGCPVVDAPKLPGGRGLTLVVNTAATSAHQVEEVREALPHARVVSCEASELADVLEEAATADDTRALGVCGGDGSVNTAAVAALRHGLPLAVLPGGRMNHFAHDLLIEHPRDLFRAVENGDAVAVDVGRFRTGDTRGHFLNALSLGVYPQLVRERARWTHLAWGRAADVLAALRVLRHERPLRIQPAGPGRGRTRPLWLLFVGNGTYLRMGLLPARRPDLADGLLDVRVVHGGRVPGARLLAAALAGPMTRSPFHTAVRRNSLRVRGIPPGTHLGYDGEITGSGPELVIDKAHEALTVYGPGTI
ncbi:bifunctional phosphatase PAP2/diacylglycerol kinase family protein [Streptomyces apocyni]|uniref:bifunctional phosphatase PAP2/diacylglycerol kinase family protein n=1 Tax=Streptomyces apocyni TaxID=2654677 RepID=UPI0012EA805C|nr:bifunctional phosphatase PAP2/diacylglycerol kinase family protein [Streptomyces apocyni]